jgi:uridylate kinase
MTSLKYKRILLKLSGEALIGSAKFGIDPEILNRLAVEIKELVDLGVQIGIVIGGGNLFRGEALSKIGLDRITGDQMGMLATMMNALAMRDAFVRAEIDTRLMSAIPMSGIIDHYDRRKAINKLELGKVVIFAGGTGNPLVTTDSAASLRAIEIKADLLLKATQVEGIYSADPNKDPKATLYSEITYDEALKKELKVMDLTAFCQCRDQNLNLRVFNIHKVGALKRIILGANEGTLVSNENYIMPLNFEKKAEDRMQKSLEMLKDEFTKVRTSRAHPSLLDHVIVNCYGSETPLSQVASVNASDAQTLSITPYDRTTIPAIEKAILMADLGLNPVTSGTTVRVPMPPLNEDRRKEFVKLVKAEAEKTRVAVRNVRRDVNTDIKKDEDLSEDDEKRVQDKIQKLTDRFIKEIDVLLAEKEKDLLHV